MIVAYSDASMDDNVLSVGYVLFHAEYTDEDFLDTGCRVINLNEYEQRNIEWTSQKAECYAAIIAVRQALDYSNDVLLLNIDNDEVVRKLKEDDWHGEPYFTHAFFSFANRFSEYRISAIHRERNSAAHAQARNGLEIGRQLQEGVL